MRYPAQKFRYIQKAVSITVILMILSGCASSADRYTTGCLRSAMNKDDLSDNELLMIFDKIYNLSVGTAADTSARDITLTAVENKIKVRGSSPDILERLNNRPFKRVDLKKWTDGDLIATHNSLIQLRKTAIEKDRARKALMADKGVEETVDESGRAFWSFKAKADQNKEPNRDNTIETLRVVRLTALYSIENELTRRDSARGSWRAAGGSVVAGIGAAARIAFTLAAFMI